MPRREHARFCSPGWWAACCDCFRATSLFDLFEAAADNMAESARLLDELLQTFVDPKAKRLTQREHEGDRITHAILTRLNSTFVTPVDRAHAHYGEVDPGRPAGVATGGSPRAASRTRRAPQSAPGSPQASRAWLPHAVLGHGVGIFVPR